MSTRPGYLQNIWSSLFTVLVGMRITWRHLFVTKVTRQYPAERYTLPERARNRLYVNMDDCIGCDQCARACPVNCIDIETAKVMPGEDLGVTSGGKKKALWVTKFDIDIAKCCYCSLCVWPCPTECIKMTDVFEFSELERNKLIYNYITLTPDEAVLHKENADRAAAEAAAKKAAAKAALPAKS
jgi:formate hydrogenlyase subunit 6/NADH:ubiquinone oxidoreductase subunit I